jgi:hypothetical protein
MVKKACTTTRQFKPGGICGKPAIYVEGEYAECAECAGQPGSLYATRKYAKGVAAGPAIGAKVDVHRHGKVYIGTVERVTRGGTVFAKVTYGTGATRIVKV